MRILLVFIVVLNLLYAGWVYLNPGHSTDGVPPLPDNLKTLELLRESDTVAQQTAAVKDSLPIVAAADADGTEIIEAENALAEKISKPVKSVACYTLGPFRDKNIMQQLRDSMAEHVSKISVRKRQESVKHRYWVFIPALPNRKRAKLMAEKLRKRNINDFYIVFSGQAKNRISLGHYREPKHANRRMKQVTGLGFKTEVDVVYRNYDIYWLDYQLDDTGKVDLPIDEYLNEGVSQLARECNSG